MIPTAANVDNSDDVNHGCLNPTSSSSSCHTPPVATSSTTVPTRRRRNHHRIAMVCDFFYPRLGGVEMHIWSLSQHLIRLGHKVIIITHAYNGRNKSGDDDSNDDFGGGGRHRKGVRYLPGPLKVYYCPIIPMTDQDALPTITSTFPLIRYILLREDITIIHSHQATSVMANECIVYASALNIPCVYTDHSLFGFDDLAGVILNRVLQTTLSTVNAAICVSNACRDNFILRTNIHPKRVHVIPNAVDPTKFVPSSSSSSSSSSSNDNDDNKRIKIVVVSRLVYRKGVDLLVGIIPQICEQLKQVDFIIGGDGNKLLDLQEMVERQQLQDRVEFLGSVPHENVASVLGRGDIFLNCSLTESFCIAILEAASCGLLVVSTNVGGVPEVLPPDMILLANSNVSALVDAVTKAVERQEDPTTKINPMDAHRRVEKMYSWHRVAKQTIQVYDEIMKQPKRNFLQRLECYLSIGSIAGIVACLLAIIIELWIYIVSTWLQPKDTIDVVPDLAPFAAADSRPVSSDIATQKEKNKEE